MSKGLDALNKIINSVDGYTYYAVNLDREYDIIEKELKQAEENEKLLNVFKNALTIEHHEYPIVEHDHSEDAISCLVTELYTIRQNELEKDMRKALREWVLKNAFPKEIKALEVISQNFKLVGNCLHAKNPYAESGWVFVKELEDEQEHNAWKEVLL